MPGSERALLASPRNGQRFEALDGLRGVAALMVVLLHTAVQSDIFYLTIVRHADVFVEVFFVLSGFVITYKYAARIDDRWTLREFFVRRIARLWPLHATMLVLFLGLDAGRYVADALGLLRVGAEFLQAMTDPARVVDVVAEVGLVHALWNETAMFWNFPSWSISAEMAAYLAFGLVWACLRGPLRDAAVVALLIMALLVTGGEVKPGFGGTFDYGIFRAIAGFFVGYWAQRTWRAMAMDRLPAATLFEVTAVAAIVVLAYQGEGPVTYVIAPFVFGAVVLVFAIGGGQVSRALRSPPLQALGTWSYGIYLTHIFVLALVGLAVRIAQRVLETSLFSASHSAEAPNDSLIDFGNPWLMDAVTIVILGLVIFAARLAHRRVEMPAQRRLLAMFAKARGR